MQILDVDSTEITPREGFVNITTPDGVGVDDVIVFSTADEG